MRVRAAVEGAIHIFAFALLAFLAFAFFEALRLLAIGLVTLCLLVDAGACFT